MNATLCPAELTAKMPLDDRRKVELAWSFAHDTLASLTRRTGERYDDHGLEVALILRELSSDPSLLCIALLHDVLVHPEGERLLDDAPINDEEKAVVRRMHELRRLHIDADNHDLDRVLDAFLHDERMLFLRMAHRLNDIRHLDRFEKALRRNIANETLHMYTAIAGRLGFDKWRYEMEDLCFHTLYPATAKRLEKMFAEAKVLDETCLEHAKRFLEKTFQEQGISARIEGRIKGLYSTYRKMIVKRRKFHELSDRLALRIIVQSIDDCYRTLGLVHGCMHPIAGKLKDYIGAPKENGYRSIHTVVYPLPGVTEQPIEIQIRTEQMHRESEEGSSAHIDYKEWRYTLRARPTRASLFRNLESLRIETRSPAQFEKALRTYFREDHIVLFDAENHLYHIKKPATAMDFACITHGKRCSRLRSVRINGREQPLDTPLHDGDIVEVEFSRNSLLKADWIHGCHHKAARKMIRDMLKETRRTAVAPASR
ncbi:bifunctional (p)ppGpp synthetase/guanosine-3',5'-bis(diphosphate) 3'-pyrophosphohydrolase [Candidatus Peregrinibacteria bacterium]|nr:bifunctional (p)ppGpp synthetase/guanosine-3',5'-bis(diphosphate) 3'-pyrophosphohydrolase [Candidatus Peregrinibacteria bacterium]